MITFKTFLSEAFVTPWKAESTDLAGAINFLNRNCKDGLKAVANGGLLFRGMPSSKNSYTILDSSESLRTSRDSTNSYQLFMDNSEALKDYPSRSRSFICASDPETAHNHGRVFVMIPVDGTSIAVADRSDIFETRTETEITGIMDLQYLDSKLRNFFMAMDIKPADFKYTDIKLINKTMSAFTPGELIVIWRCFALEQYPIDKPPSSAPDEVLDAYEFLSSMTAYGIKKPGVLGAVKTLGKYVEKIGMYDDFLNNLYDVFKRAPKNARATAMASALTPEALKLKLVRFGEQLPTHREVWFSGKCISIKVSAFIEILEELKKNKMPIHSNYSDLYDYAYD